MRSIGVVTVARSDYGIYLPILRQMQAIGDLDFYLLVTGMHLAPEFGLTIQQIKADGFPIGERIEMLLSSDQPEGISKSMGLGVTGFAQAFGHRRPDILVVLGDRFDMYTAAVAALPFKIPVAHLHGGELTFGALDDALRHSITKLSHLHFVSTPEYARRVIQLGEEPWRVTVSGAPGLDHLEDLQLMGRQEINEKFGLHLEEAPLLVTFHPVTLEYEQIEDQTDELLAALDVVNKPVLFTLPNADTGGRRIAEKIRQFVVAHSVAQLVENLGTTAYFSLMAISAAMVGNSSSGILEAPSFELPVVNIGRRQAGRVRGMNVIDVGNSRQEILAGIHQAVSAEFRQSLRGMVNPYKHGRAAEIIVERLRTVDLDQRLLLKQFYDLQVFQGEV